MGRDIVRRGCGRRRLPRAVLSATRGLFFLGNFCLFVRMRALLDSVRETPPHLVAVVALFVNSRRHCRLDARLTPGSRGL